MTLPADERTVAVAEGSDETPLARVLVVEDDLTAQRGLTKLLRTWGYAAEGAGDGEEALARIADFRPSIVLADLVMPKLGGLDLLKAVKDQLADLTFILLTAQGSVETAVTAMKEGAYDYLAKPVDPQRLRVVLQKIVERQDTLREVEGLRRQLHERGRLGRSVGNAPSIRSVFQLVELAAPSDASVLISGESGTGKELVAQTIHQLSRRRDMPFVAINCAAIPESLLESEIFGHERGAFTGAVDRRLGCFELAHKGTLFLDEIAEMPLATQAKLLRVLQERSVRRLGAQKEQPCDVRVVAATNLDPRRAVEHGRLREDLYYRINVIAVSMPPLRDRKEDIPLLVQAFIAEFNAQNGKALRAVDPEALRMLQDYDWPGNIRELRNVIERAVILAHGEFIQPGNLPPDLGRARPAAAAAAVAGTTESSSSLTPGMRVEDVERRLIELTLEHTANNKTRAAEILGISSKTLHNKLNKFRLRRGSDDTAPS